MEWTRIDKSKSEIPQKVGHCREYKKFLRIEAEMKCVYCAISEDSLGGIDHFHVEHYRPKSLDEFKHLEKEYSNLFYSCPICNRFKSDDWPNEPKDDHSVVSYPDPNKTDYNELYEINSKGLLEGCFVASNYMIEKLFLNRPQLINERNEYKLFEKFAEIIEIFKVQINQVRAKKDDSQTLFFLSKHFDISTSIEEILIERKSIRNYEPEEIKRQV